MKRLVATVKEVRGHCPVYKGGERLIISGPEIDLAKTDEICIHALPPILHFTVALREGISPRKLGLAKKGNKAYVQCPDPSGSYTDGGTVIFELELEK